MKSKNDIPGEISLDQAGIVLSHSVRLLDILGDAECQRIIGQQFVTFLVNEVKIELGRYFAEFEKFWFEIRLLQGGMPESDGNPIAESDKFFLPL